MIRIAIVDDEILFLNLISETVLNCFKNIGVEIDFSSYSNPECLYFDIVEKNLYDIYILDIKMPKLNGIKLAQYIRNYSKEAYIIFLTSHIKFALQGYDVNAYQFISKDSIDKLTKTLIRIYKEIDNNSEKYLIISNNVRYEKIFYRNIIYMYKEQKNVFLVCKNGISFIRTTLKNMYIQINDPCFIYVDKKYIVNIIYVTRIHNLSILLDNGDELPLSRSHASEIKEAILNYWKAHIRKT